MTAAADTPRPAAWAIAETDIAIIGMAGRFPGAHTHEELWALLMQGKESIQFEARAQNDAAQPSTQGHIVHACANVADTELFDAPFFGYSAREADLIDPQQRIFLECSWEALENAGYDPLGLSQRVGVFGGSGVNTYAMRLSGAGKSELQSLQVTLANDKDYLATRVSYKLNLIGPSVAVQTACSSSLVAVHLACQSLIDLECDMALAGGVSIRSPSPTGYRYTPGSIFSPDGHCRAFDERASGTIAGSGAGVVVLKRFAQAIADGDPIYAVIRGSAINNDGHDKAGFTAPSIEGQARVIQAALFAANLSPSEIDYIEAHGTGTPLGDAIEIAALKQVFTDRDPTRPCLIGAVKTNLGHLDTAAGVAGLIKTALSLQKELIPATVHFERPNPTLELEGSGLKIVSERQAWPAMADSVRHAGVSSFGMGGTNAHLVLAEAHSSFVPDRAISPAPQILTLSARTPAALDRATARLLSHIEKHPQPLEDVAYTLQIGRTAFQHRRVFVCSDNNDAMYSLAQARIAAEHPLSDLSACVPLIFLFPGQGSESKLMGAELYEHNGCFRTHFQSVAGLIRQYGGPDIQTAVVSEASTAKSEPWGTLHAQLALFAIEYATGKLLIELNARPAALIGHSLGEITAACLAGVFTLDAAVRFVLARGRLMHSCGGGAMLAVGLSERAAARLCEHSISVAAVNGPEVTVLCGTSADIERLYTQCKQQQVLCTYVNRAHAFHSAMMQPCVAELASLASHLNLQRPRIPLLDIEGQWVTGVHSDYWGSQVTQTVRFASCIQTAAAKFADALFIEVGPDQILTRLARLNVAHLDCKCASIATFKAAADTASSYKTFASALAHLWTRGVRLNWPLLHSDTVRRTSLPTYPFERSRHWAIENESVDGLGAGRDSARLPLERWICVPTWVKAPHGRTRGRARTEADGRWLILTEGPIGNALIGHLSKAGAQVVEVRAGTAFSRVDDSLFTINLGSEADYLRLLQLTGVDSSPCTVVYLCQAASQSQLQPSPDGSCELLPLLRLARASQQARLKSLDIVVAGHGITGCYPGELIEPSRALLTGAAACLPLEMPTVSCSIIDLPAQAEPAEVARHIVDEACHGPLPQPMALRESGRWLRLFVPLNIQPAGADVSVFRHGGTYLLVGGTGALGTGLARLLAEQYHAKVILMSRSAGSPTPSSSSDVNGADILRVSVDITDRKAFSEAVELARGRFGKIHGVLHLAAIPSGGLIQARTEAAGRAVLAPKTLGAANVLEVFSDTQLDFLVLFSSVTAVSGALGQCDYSAANAFLDSLPLSRLVASCPFPVCAIAWDAWQLDSWQSHSLNALPQARAAAREYRDQFGIRLDEGLTMLRTCLAAGLSQCVVTTRELNSVIAAHRALDADSLSSLLSLSRNEDSPACAVAHRTELAAGVLGIWAEVLGTSAASNPAGSRFLDLGGHSLLAIELAARIKNLLGVQIELRWLLANPTAEELLQLIDPDQSQRSIDSEVSELLAEIESLTTTDTEESTRGAAH